MFRFFLCEEQHFDAGVYGNTLIGIIVECWESEHWMQSIAKAGA